ncbi:uncharacterized protein LOC116260178 [Nymphaea colorata]|nr:uncharacterized protein LOC116260178 [Nymphaea colorata]XP_031494176.1 uncharacterized protein LOC116260178 [Nymphaea colorata]
MLCVSSPLSLPRLSPSINAVSLRYRLLPHVSRSGWKKFEKREYRRTGCRAELAQDAPFAVAIGACILNSLVFPAPGGSEEDDRGSSMDSDDTRFAVMGIISFIPYFNWMSWIFAWLDTGRRQYLVYAVVYLAPYLRTNLSLSPEESWLPIASILLCIVHVQLEASIKNGDLQNIQLFGEILRTFSGMIGKKESHSQVSRGPRKERKEHMKLPSAHEEMKKKIRDGSGKRKVGNDSNEADNARDKEH